MLVKLQLPTKSGDILGAKGNSGDMVTKIEDTGNRRSKVRKVKKYVKRYIRR
jgi:hypothetical protein